MSGTKAAHKSAPHAHAFGMPRKDRHAAMLVPLCLFFSFWNWVHFACVFFMPTAHTLPTTAECFFRCAQKVQAGKLDWRAPSSHRKREEAQTMDVNLKCKKVVLQTMSQARPTERDAKMHADDEDQSHASGPLAAVPAT
jgi:hypothetical protein